MKHWMKYFLFAWFGAALLLLVGGCCGGPSDPEAACIREAETNPVDYSDRANWVLLPDRTPEKLEPVDIFYIYPTVYVSRTHPVMHWDSPKMAAKTRNIALQQTGPFSTLGNVYAPFVRQGELHRALADLAERARAATNRCGSDSAIRRRRSAIISNTGTAGARLFWSGTARGPMTCWSS